jgi:molecular chaperone GrpE
VPAENDGPVIRDKRVIDPTTGELRRPASTTPEAGESAAAEAAGAAAETAALTAATALADERLNDLQRLNAEFVNYRKRVDRDRAVDYARGVGDVVDALIPVLDDLEAARQHGELTGPFAAIADKLELVLQQRFGVERYGEAGEEFDPAVHEALMHATSAAVEQSSVSQVLQPGYKVGERIVRAARVAVVGPQ